MAIRIPVTFDADASDLDRDLERGTKSATSRVSGMLSSTLKKGAKVAGAGIVAVIGTSLVKGFGRLKAIDDAQAKLRGLGYTGKQISSIMESAGKAVKGTAFGLGEAAGTAGILAAANVPLGQMEKILRLVGDAASIGGVELNDMGAIFGKVAAKGKLDGEVLQQLLENQIGILPQLGKFYGVTANEAAKMVSEGKVSFQDFTKVMEQTLGGAAAETGKTFSGSLANVGAALGRLGAAAIGPAFQALPKIFIGLQGAIDALIPYAEKGSKIIGDLFSSFGSGSDIGGSIVSSLASVGKAIGQFVADILPTMQKVGTQIGKALGPAITKISTAVATKLLPAFNKLLPILAPIAKVLLQVFGSAVVGAINGFVKVITGAIDVIAGLIDFVIALVTGDWAGAWGAFKQIVSGILTTILGLIQVWWNIGILGVFRKGVALIKGLWTGAWNAIKAVPGAVMKGISSLVSKSLGLIGKAFAGAVKTYVGVWKQIFSTIFGIIRNGLKVWRSVFGGALSAIRTVFTSTFKAIRNVVRDGISNVIGAIRSVPGQITSLGGKFLNAGKTLMGKIFQGLKNAAKNIGSIASDIASGFRDAIKGALNQLIDLMNKGIPNKLGWGKFSINIPDNPIPHLAKGTQFWRGGSVLVGEEGPELVNLPRGSEVKTAGQTRALARDVTADSFSSNRPTNVKVIQNYYGPTTSGGRMREIEWTLRYAVRGDRRVAGGLAA